MNNNGAQWKYSRKHSNWDGCWMDGTAYLDDISLGTPLQPIDTRDHENRVTGNS